MLTSTNYTVNPKLFQEACHHLPTGEMKTTINQPTGDFFYDPWIIKDEYKGTVWEGSLINDRNRGIWWVNQAVLWDLCIT